MIPGLLISIVTFPGVIVHELAHQIFCRIFRTAVFEVCYFRFDNPVGYVIHEHPRKASHQIWIGVGPFFVNTILGALIALPAAIPVIWFQSATLLDFFMVWLGVSIAMHSFPSIGDAQSILSHIKSSETPKLTKIVAAPVVGLIFIGAIGSVFWLDLIYGISVVALLPFIIVHFLA